MGILDQTVTMDDSTGRHFYCGDEGQRYPSVTTVLDSVAYNKTIVGWANSLGFRHIKYEDELNRTAMEGTFMHAYAQCIVDPEKGKEPQIVDPLTRYYVTQRVTNLRMKLDAHRGYWNTIFSEQPFISKTYEIGGTIDWYTEWYGKKTIFDFKSSRAVRDKHLLQLGGYYHGLIDNGEEPEQAGIILVGRDLCTINLIDLPTLQRAAEMFDVVHHWYKVHQELDTVLTRDLTTV